MRIVFCLNHYLPGQVAGTELYTHHLAKALKKVGHEVFVVVPGFAQTAGQTDTVDGVDVFTYPETQVVDREFLQARRPPAGLVSYIALVTKLRPDIVHFQEVTASNGISVFHVQAMKELRFKTVMTFHLAGHSCHNGTLMYENKQLCNGVIDVKKCAWCGYVNKPLPGVGRLALSTLANLFYNVNYDTRTWQSKAGTSMAFPFLIKELKENFTALIGACDQLVSITDWYREVLVRNGVDRSKITCIRQGIGEEESDSGNRSPEKALRLVFVGRITKIKGLHRLIEAMKGLPKEKIELAIYGRNNDDEYYRQCVRDSDGMNNIHWKGALSPELVVATLRQFDILCLPSEFSEMSPLVIQEAFAAGLPVVASNVYGNAEQITHGENGWLFRFADTLSLQQCLNGLMADRARVEKAKDQVPQVRRFQSLATDYEQLYHKMLRS